MLGNTLLLEVTYGTDDPQSGLNQQITYSSLQLLAWKIMVRLAPSYHLL